MLKVVHDKAGSNDEGSLGGSLLHEIAREGARQMLAAALRAEVAAHVESHAGELDDEGHRLVVRNGFHEPREVLTAAGAEPVSHGTLGRNDSGVRTTSASLPRLLQETG